MDFDKEASFVTIGQGCKCERDSVQQPRCRAGKGKSRPCLAKQSRHRQIAELEPEVKAVAPWLMAEAQSQSKAGAEDSGARWCVQQGKAILPIASASKGTR
eukprot:1149145-Pelagomonas_calceolata.AAC.2